jgi:hypothetical protein
MRSTMNTLALCGFVFLISLGCGRKEKQSEKPAPDGEAQTVSATGRNAAVIDSVSVFSCGDSASATGESFAPMEIVTVGVEKEAWTEILSGAGGKKGWIRSGHLAYNPVDVEAASAIAAALAEPDSQKRLAGLQAIAGDSRFDKSVFLAKIPAPALSPEIPAPPDSEAGTQPESSGVNMAE